MIQRISKIFFIVILIIVGFFYIGYPQDCQDSTKVEQTTDNSKQEQQQILKELKEIKSMLQLMVKQQTTARNIPEQNIKDYEFSLSKNNFVMGEKTAKLILIEFIDYQCPFCSRFTHDSLPQIMKEYVDTGKLCYAIVDLPLPFHKFASKAAEASHCAAEQGKFWEMHDKILANQDSLENITHHAASIGLDTRKFEESLKSNKYSEKILKDKFLADKIGIKGTPGFVLAKIDYNDSLKCKGITVFRGARPFEFFKKEIDNALKELQ